jgi:invasion protein IalB
VAIKVDLIEREDNRAARLQIMVPPGVYLEPGIKLGVDGGSLLQLPYVLCLSNACFAGSVAEPSFIRTLESGRTLTVEVINAGLLTATASLPLGEFAWAHQGPPAQVFESNLKVEQQPQR